MPSPIEYVTVARDRFSIVSAFPAAVVVIYCFVLVRIGAFGGAPDLSRLAFHGDGGPWVGTLLTLAVLVFILALLLQPFQLGLVRLLEGYWGSSRAAQFLNKTLSAPRRRWLSSRLNDLNTSLESRPSEDDSVDTQLRAVRKRQRDEQRRRRAQDICLRYPPQPDRVLPTALGNALRSFEDRAGQRYGMDTVPVFRRLHPLLAPSVTKEYTSQRLQLDSAAGLCIAFMVITGVSLPALVGDGWWTVTPFVTAVLAVLTYAGAIASARAMGRVVHTAFDLYRHDLLAAMRYRLPENPALEYAFNLRLSDFLRDNDPRPHTAVRTMPDAYEHPPLALPSMQAEASPGAR